MRNDPYSIKPDYQLQEPLGYTKCSYVNCDSCKNFVDETSYIVNSGKKVSNKTRNVM